MADAEVLSGAPTKRFFVSMLPRDIELDDAILDLVDNSVDGAMRRERENLDEDRPFAGYRCDLTIEEGAFALRDNCGGIPSEYLNGAFRLGRPNTEIDANLPTIGVYGIGMKRAIFKMAREATVISRSDERAVKVHYGPEWLDPSNEDWELPIEDVEDNDEFGVTIEICELQDEVARKLGRETFRDGLRDRLGQHFAYIMGKGFTVTLNGDEVRPETVRLILSDRIEPFDYEANVDGVRIKVTVGFYRNLTRQAELEEATDPNGADGRARATDEAGITVICNDRVVLMSDKTTITGWGVANTPRYHPQFRAISGLISFYSVDAKLLPISTTKRDLDTDSDVYRPARNAAIDGIILFIGFTNRWKGNEEAVDELLVPANQVEARSISLVAEKGRGVRGTQHEERKYVPELPIPERGTSKRRVAFSRDIDEIRKLGEALLGDSTARPGDVGVAAWEETLRGQAGHDE